MTTGVLQHQPILTDVSPRYRPFASTAHQVTKGRYITSNDPRGYIPVYEYPLNNQWIMMDIDDGYILWTGIWKALGNSKADIVKMIESQPDLAPFIRRVRGGYLKIQGTWMPYDVALKLSRRVAWNIREDLIPIFGPSFPSTCLSPDQPGYGQVVPSSGRKRPRRSPAATKATASTAATTAQKIHWPNESSPMHPSAETAQYHHGTHQECPPNYQASLQRYSPYPTAASGSRRPSSSSRGVRLSLDINSLSIHSANSSPIDRRVSDGDQIVLPPIRNGYSLLAQRSSPSGYALPPISALEDLRGVNCQDSAAVLRRLRCDDQANDDRTASDYYGRPLSAPVCKSSSPTWSSRNIPPIVVLGGQQGQYNDDHRRRHRRVSSAMSDSDFSGSHDDSSGSSYQHSSPSTPLSSLGSGQPTYSSPKWQAQYSSPSMYDSYQHRPDDHWHTGGIRTISLDDARMSSCRDESDSIRRW